MRKWLVAGAITWPAILASAVVARVDVHGGHALASVWAAYVYLAASRVCHQLPARSFHTAGVSWPVCGRCAGLYAAAPFGALAAAWSSARRAADAHVRLWLAACALPTAVTVALEWGHLLPVGNVTRAAAALPLGAAVAFAIVYVAAPRHPVNQVN